MYLKNDKNLCRMITIFEQVISQSISRVIGLPLAVTFYAHFYAETQSHLNPLCILI